MLTCPPQGWWDLVAAKGLDGLRVVTGGRGESGRPSRGQKCGVEWKGKSFGRLGVDGSFLRFMRPDFRAGALGSKGLLHVNILVSTCPTEKAWHPSHFPWASQVIPFSIESQMKFGKSCYLSCDFVTLVLGLVFWSWKYFSVLLEALGLVLGLGISLGKFSVLFRSWWNYTLQVTFALHPGYLGYPLIAGVKLLSLQE